MRSIKTRVAKVGFLFLALCVYAPSAFALTVLTGDEAARYLGDIKAHILGGQYTYEILSRSHRDAMHGRFSDAVIFNPGGGNFLYPRRKDGQHIFVIDSLKGRAEDPATEDSWRQKISNALSDDNRIPYVFLDDAKNELAIVYVGIGTKVTSKINEDKLLQVELEVEGARDARDSFKRRHGV